MELKRRPIKNRIRGIILLIVLSTMVVTIAGSIYNIFNVRTIAKKELISRTVSSVETIDQDRADLMAEKLARYEDNIATFTNYATELYEDAGNVPPRMVDPPSSKNEGEYVMQRGLASKDIKLEDVIDEIGLLGNMEPVFESVILKNRDVISTVYMGTETGVMVAYDANSTAGVSRKGETIYDYFDTEWYQTAKKAKKPIYTDVYSDAYGKGLMVSCAAPFNDENGKFHGVVCMDIEITSFYRNMVQVELPEAPNAYAFLVDAEGNLISDAEGDSTSIYDDKNVDDDIRDHILSGGEGIELSEAGYFYAYSPVHKTDWMFCICVSEDELLEPVHVMDRHINYLVIGFFFFAAIVAMVVFWLSAVFTGRLMRPIFALERDAKEISGGNLDHRAEVYVNDEIGDLAGAFNDMADSLKQYIRDLTDVTAEKERIGTELSVAAQIQADMLPRIFPPFPEKTEFDIYAAMTPAKEVGGDFYDFFLVDNDHIGLVMADVSGKGVPAALFMAISKTLIKAATKRGTSCAEVLFRVNEQLCERNESELFVTVWLAVVEISTGKGVAANAGHEHPALRRAGGRFELVEYDHSPVLGAMAHLPYEEHEFQLYPGDSLFVYTDGVPEAQNRDGELFETDRMLEALNEDPDAGPREMLLSVRSAIDDFVQDTPRFDDITMLGFTYHGPKEEVKMAKQIEAKVENLPEVLSLVNEQLEDTLCSEDDRVAIDIAVEEIFVNIANYAYGEETGKADLTARIKQDPTAIEITLCDSGNPYNPLEKPDPDITLSAEDRPIGGLGIFMVKQSMDDVRYEYKDGKNMLTIVKKLGGK